MFKVPNIVTPSYLHRRLHTDTRLCVEPSVVWHSL